MQGCFKNRKKNRKRSKKIRSERCAKRPKGNRERTPNNKKESKKIHLKHKRCKDALEVEKKRERKVSMMKEIEEKHKRCAKNPKENRERSRIIKENRIEENFGEKYGRKFV